MGVSKNKKINHIFRQFLYNDRLKFSEIEKNTCIRSNELAYLLKRMVSEGILLKENQDYLLTEDYEKQIPHFSESIESSSLPVVLIACVKDKKVLLIKRKKRVYKDYWSLPGGRIRAGETIKNATLRILKEKTFLDSKFVSINTVVNERYVNKGKIRSSFILFLTKAKPESEIKEKEAVKWVNVVEAGKLRIIPSDLWLIQNKLNSRIKVAEEVIEEDNELTMKFI
ncbi:NUDIX domain-containing protein [Candidatus Woesearchaeota archaeon]|nr:NUDIX domain-containing protein [Candidatus Woesearchaeota archaeon]